MQVAGITGTIVVQIDQHGERNMFPSRGASSLLRPIESEWLDDLEVLHITGYSLQDQPTCDSVIDAALRVKEAGGRLSLDVSSTGMIDLFGIDEFKKLVIKLQPDVLSANADESAYLDLANGSEAGSFLDKLGNVVLLARAGKDPTRIFEKGELVASVPVEPVDKVRDMTGAGDAFNAGFLTYWVRNRGDLIGATEAAHALARSVLHSPGATEPNEAPEFVQRS